MAAPTHTAEDGSLSTLFSADGIAPTPYPKMILEAIVALNESGGSTADTISSHIESVYGAELPPAHASFVAAHLSRMVGAGELFLAAGETYTLPNLDSPAKRGRGRQPKSSNHLTAEASSEAGPRRRGRPPKPRDPLAPEKVPKPRGRPRKHPDSGPAGGDQEKKPRGRPPKSRTQFTEVGFV